MGHNDGVSEEDWFKIKRELNTYKSRESEVFKGDPECVVCTILDYFEAETIEELNEQQILLMPAIAEEWREADARHPMMFDEHIIPCYHAPAVVRFYTTLYRLGPEQ